MAVVTTVETREYMENGKRMTVTITQHEGLETYTDKDWNNGEPFQAVIATFMDYGKQGVTRCYTPPRAPASDEERARNRENIYRAFAGVLRDMGLR